MNIIKRLWNNYTYKEFNLNSTSYYVDLNAIDINFIDKCDRCGIKLPKEKVLNTRIVARESKDTHEIHLVLCGDCFKNICKKK